MHSINLTKTEAEIVRCLSDGMNAPDIARYRFRSEETVRFHIKNIHLKLNARTNAQAVFLAVKAGVIKSIFLLLMFSSAFPSDNPREDDKRRLKVARTFSVRAGKVRENLV